MIHGSVADAARVASCAGSNAYWCDAVYRAHGRPGEFRPAAGTASAVWLNRHAALPFYPNVVTLKADVQDAQLAAVDELLAGRPSFAVKDSFAALDLSSRGFNVLFEATWLWWEGDRATAEPTGLQWSPVVDEPGLARWEAVWAGLDDGAAVVEAERVFRPGLLAEPGVALLAGSRAGRVVAVAALNVTGEVVGVSNVFSATLEPGELWPGVVAAAGRLFPGRPLAGYEQGDDLAAALAVGFFGVGALRVWAR